MIPQDAAGKERYDRERHEQRCKYREYNSHGETANKITGRFREEHQRKEREYQCYSTSDHGEAYLFRSLYGSVLLAQSISQVSFNVLDHDDRIVDENTQRDDQ